MEVRRKGLDPAQQEKLDRINRELKRKDKEVVTVVHDYYRTITEILVENSWILRCLIRSETFRRFLRWLAGDVQSGDKYRSAYRFYREYSKALQAT